MTSLSGCNNNEITKIYILGYFCAGVGRDRVTGGQLLHFLQLAWAINFDLAGDFGTPVITFSCTGIE